MEHNDLSNQNLVEQGPKDKFRMLLRKYLNPFLLSILMAVTSLPKKAEGYSGEVISLKNKSSQTTYIVGEGKEEADENEQAPLEETYRKLHAKIDSLKENLDKRIRNREALNPEIEDLMHDLKSVLDLMDEMVENEEKNHKLFENKYENLAELIVISYFIISILSGYLWFMGNFRERAKERAKQKLKDSIQTLQEMLEYDTDKEIRRDEIIRLIVYMYIILKTIEEL